MRKSSFLLSVLMLFSFSVLEAQNPFSTIWQTDIPGESNDNQIIFPAQGGYNYSWQNLTTGDTGGGVSAYGEITITFPTPGKYLLKVVPEDVVGNGNVFHRFFYGLGGVRDHHKLIEIAQWGDVPWSSFSFAFARTEKLTTISAPDVPDLSRVDDMSYAFALSAFVSTANIGAWDVSNVKNMEGLFGGGIFNGDIGAWDVSNVENMESMFESAYSFNQDISGWDTRNVTTMEFMFSESRAFNQPLNDWDVSGVSNLVGMFRRSVFNQPLNDWNVENVTNFASMFSESPFNQPLDQWNVENVESMISMFEASNFNQDISGWDVRNVKSMNRMFKQTPFNQDIGSWDMGNVEDIYGMFDSADQFDQDLGSWDLGSVTTMDFIFNNSNISCEKYSRTLKGWAGNPNTPSNVYLAGSGLTYSPDIQTEVDYLKNTLGWDLRHTLGTCLLTEIPNALPWVTLWNTGSDSEITLYGEGDYVYTWQKIGTPSAMGSGTGSNTSTINFGSAGTFEVKIYPLGSSPLTEVIFQDAPVSEREKLIEISQWGEIPWSSLRNAFFGATNLEITTTDVPDLSRVYDMTDAFVGTTFSTVSNLENWDVSNVTDMTGLFASNINFNQNINNWDVSNVKYMGSMFQEASSFNQPLDLWNVGKVENMQQMFDKAVSFNGDIRNWDVKNVHTFSAMFNEAIAFNQDIGSWDVSGAVYLNSMFMNAGAFNSDISSWDVSNVTFMSYMFKGATSFNIDIGEWDVSSLEDAYEMFSGATAFNRHLGYWKLENFRTGSKMFANSGLSCSNYSLTLHGWANTNKTASNVDFLNQTSQYSPELVDDLDYLMNDLNWTISGHTQGSCSLPDLPPSGDPFITVWKTDNEGNSGNTEIYINLEGEYYYEWEMDGNSNIRGSGEGDNFMAIDFGAPGEYILKIFPKGRDPFHRISFYSGLDDKKKILGVLQWGDVEWSSFESAFYQCENLELWVSDVPDLTSVQDMSFAFSGTSVSTFNGASWDVSNVTNMRAMFLGATKMNQRIEDWDVSGVTDMGDMFNGASIFNQDISRWDVSNVVSTIRMFHEASNFDQDLSNWNLEDLELALHMFYDSGLSCDNYSITLRGWANNPTTATDIDLGSNNMEYSPDIQADVAYLEQVLNWTLGEHTIGSCVLDIPDYYYVDGVWYPENPSNVSTSGDYIRILNGMPTITGELNVQRLNIDNGAILRVLGVMNLYGGIFADGILYFAANEDVYGELGYVDPSATINGEVVTEIYMQDRRSYRMLSPAVTTSTSIHDNWQEGATSRTDNPAPGFGTHITGSKNDQENGFDATETGNVSIWTVDLSAQEFVALPNTDVNTLEAGNPYLMFIRGGRDVNLDSNDSHSGTRLRAKGTPAIGSQVQNFNTLNVGDFAMFGNPYQSAVDVNALFTGATNVNPNHYYIYDPGQADQGGYVLVTLPGGTNSLGSPANQYLQAGQAAQFATTAAGSSAVNFTESVKSPGHHTTTSATSGLTDSDMISVQLYTTSNYETGGRTHDGFAIIFDDAYSNEVTPEDGVKPMNFAENFGIENNGIYLMLERRKMPIASEVYQLYSTGYKHGKYTIHFDMKGLEDTFFYLDDAYTGSSTLLNADTAYTFEVSDATSKATDRFSIRVESRLGVEGHALSGIRLFPNPTNSDSFNIYAPHLNGATAEVRIADVSGREIYSSEVRATDNKMTVTVNETLASGIYLVTVTSAGEAQTFRLIRE